jgi:hypothetical protein
VEWYSTWVHGLHAPTRSRSYLIIDYELSLNFISINYYRVNHNRFSVKKKRVELGFPEFLESHLSSIIVCGNAASLVSLPPFPPLFMFVLRRHIGTKIQTEI